MARQDDQSAQRTEMPTPLRLAEARRRGQVPRSIDLTAAVMLLGAMVVLALLGPVLLGSLNKMTETMLGQSATISDPSASLGLLQKGLWTLLGALAPVGLLVVAIGVLINLLQVGPMASPQALCPDWARISLSEGLARTFSLRTLVRAAWLLAKLAAVGGVAWWTIRDAMPRIVSAGRMQPSDLLGEASSLVWRLALRMGVALLAMGVVDLIYQRWQYLRDLRMTRRELLADLKQMEGDPGIRARRRTLRKQTGTAMRRPGLAPSAQALAEISNV